MSESLEEKFNYMRLYQQRMNPPTPKPSPNPKPSFNITLDELKELSNSFIAPFIEENPDIPIDSFEQRMVRFENLPDDTVLFSLCYGNAQNYIQIGFKKSKIFRFTSVNGGVAQYENRTVPYFHFRKIIILSDKNWYVAPAPNDRTFKGNFRYTPVDYKIIKEIVDQLKNSFEDDSEGRYTNGLCVNGTRNNKLGY